MNYCVYKHTNLINGKVYIGITSQNPTHRWNSGYGYVHNSHFINAIKRYGWHNFSHEILFENLSKEEAYEQEKRLILLYQSNLPEYGYNNSTGGDPGSGHVCSEETRAKMSKARKGIKISQETRNKIAEIVKKRPADMRYRFSHSGLGKPSWNKGITGPNSHSYGVVFSEERRKRISEALKGKPKSDSHKAKMSEVRKGIKLSEETRAKMSAAQSGDKHSRIRPVKNVTTGEVFSCMKYAAEKYGVTITAILNCCKGKTKTSAGQKWEYI